MSKDREHGDDGFVAVDEAECRRLLREEGIGILGTLVDGEIELRPVNYAVHRGTVVIRTDRGLLFDAARLGHAASRLPRRSTTASLAVMSVDAEARTAWSVIAKGRLEPADAQLTGIRLFSWAHEGKAERIRLSIETLSGRRLEPRNTEG